MRISQIMGVALATAVGVGAGVLVGRKRCWRTTEPSFDERESNVHEGLRDADWFSVSDVARALRDREFPRKPSGSANRDARALVEFWLGEGVVERWGSEARGPSVYRWTDS